MRRKVGEIDMIGRKEKEGARLITKPFLGSWNGAKI